MPKYSITDPQSGRTVTVSGAKPPTQTDADNIFKTAGLRGTPTTPQAPVDNRGFFEKAQNFLASASPTIANIATLGLAGQGQRSQQQQQDQTGSFERSQALTKQAAALPNTDPRKKQLLDQARSIMDVSGQQAQSFQEDLSGRQRAAAITEGDLDRSNAEFALRRGFGQTSELASFLAPQAQLGRLAPAGTAATQTVSGALKAIPGIETAGRRIAGAGLAGAFPGLLSGVSQASLQAEDIKEGGIDVIEGTLLGAGFGAGIQGVSEFGRWVKEGTKVLPEKARKAAKGVYESTLKDNVKDQKFYRQAGGKDAVIDDAVRLRVPMTKQGVQQELGKYGQEYGNLVDDALAKSNKAGQRVSIVDLLKETREETLSSLNRPETRTQYNAAKNYFDDALKFYSKNPNNTWADANDVRKLLDQEVGGQILDKFDQGQKFAMKRFASTLRSNFKSNFPELKDPIRRYQLLSGLSDAFKKEPVFGLPEITTGLAGAAVTGGTGIIPGLIGGTAARSPGLKRAAATAVLRNVPEQVVSTAKSAIQPSRIPEQAAPIMGAIQRAISNENKSKTQRKRLPGNSL